MLRFNDFGKFFVNILIISLATFGLFAKVGNLGGQIRHTEIRSNNAGFDKAGNDNENKAYEREEEHDDD